MVAGWTMNVTVRHAGVSRAAMAIASSLWSVAL
jgi:hypothetical protein